MQAQPFCLSLAHFSWMKHAFLRGPGTCVLICCEQPADVLRSSEHGDALDAKLAALAMRTRARAGGAPEADVGTDIDVEANTNALRQSNGID